MPGCVEWTNYTNLGPSESLTRLDDPKVAIITQIKVIPSAPEVSRNAKTVRERALSLKYRPAILQRVGIIDRAAGRSIGHEMFRKDVTSVNALSLIYGLSQVEIDIIFSMWRDWESKTEIEYALLTGSTKAVFDKNSQGLPPDLALLAKSGLSRGEVRNLLKKRIAAIMKPLSMIATLRLSDTIFAKTLLAHTLSDGLEKVRKNYDYAIFAEAGTQAEHGEWTRKLPWYSFGIFPSIRRWDYLFPLRVLDCRKDVYYHFTMRCRRTQVVNLLMIPAMFYMHEGLEDYHKARALKDYDDQLMELIFEDMSTTEKNYAW
jgi:hypothetical protein